MRSLARQAASVLSGSQFPVPVSCPSALEFGRPTPQPQPAARTVEITVFLQRVVVVATTHAAIMERLVAARQAEAIPLAIVTEPPARRAAVNRHRCSPRSHTSGSIARPFGRISKCRCGIQLGIRHTDRADDLSPDHLLALLDVRARERPVHRVVAAAVLDDHGQAVRADRLPTPSPRPPRPPSPTCRSRAAMPTPFQRIVVLFGFTARPNR